MVGGSGQKGISGGSRMSPDLGYILNVDRTH